MLSELRIYKLIIWKVYKRTSERERERERVGLNNEKKNHYCK